MWATEKGNFSQLEMETINPLKATFILDFKQKQLNAD